MHRIFAVCVAVVLSVFPVVTAGADTAVSGIPEHRDDTLPYLLGTVKCTWSGATFSATVIGADTNFVVDQHGRYSPASQPCTLGNPPVPTPITMWVTLEQTRGLQCFFDACNWYDPSVTWETLCLRVYNDQAPAPDRLYGGQCSTHTGAINAGIRIRYTYEVMGRQYTNQSFPLLIHWNR